MSFAYLSLWQILLAIPPDSFSLFCWAYGSSAGEYIFWNFLQVGVALRQFSPMWATSKPSTKTLSLASFLPSLSPPRNREAVAKLGKYVLRIAELPHMPVLQNDFTGRAYSLTHPGLLFQKEINLYLAFTTAFFLFPYKLTLPSLLHRLVFTVAYVPWALFSEMASVQPGECQSEKICYLKINI